MTLATLPDGGRLMLRRGLVGLIVGLIAVALLTPLLLMAMVVGGLPDEGMDCGTGPSVVLAGGETDGQLSSRQLENASTVVSVGRELGMPERGLVVALAVAHQESRFRNYANDGIGSDLEPDQQGIRASLKLPHDAVGTDHGSLGIFQQQWPWWGSMSELMDPAVAAEKFYAALARVPRWTQMSVTEAGQAVQNSAHPDAYADDVTVALALLGLSKGEAGAVEAASYEAAGTDSCVTTAAAAGGVVFPLPPGSGYVDRQNWGDSGTHWSTRHTGTDFSVSCGTPVLAATAGTVVIRTDEAWAGPWLVEVSTGTDGLSTWYAHMQTVDVADGQQVRAGQQLGEVGNLGNSTGCHLHFEVHPNGGPMYQDDIDPTAWLQVSVGQGLGTTVQSVASTSSGEFVLATFNVLGHSHTAPGGNRPGWAPSATRTRWAVELFDSYGVDVVGLQEFQPRQKRAFLAQAGDRYAVYSPRGDTVNSIAWRRTRWQFVNAASFPVPYFNGNLRPMPIVRLRDRETGGDAIFINVHNPASTNRFPSQGRFRAEAVRREVAMVRGLTTKYGLPVFLVGDFNAQAEAFCPITSGGRMTSAAGGSNDERCIPPAYRGVDWLFGSSLAALGRHVVVRDGVDGRISDHPFVVARAMSMPASSVR